jgi:hypothetical protein
MQHQFQCHHQITTYKKSSSSANIQIRIIPSSSSDLMASCNLTVFQKGTYCFGVKIFNKLPSNIKDQAYDINKVRSAVKRFLLLNHFIHWTSILTVSQTKVS